MWNTRAPTPDECAALRAAKAKADRPENHQTNVFQHFVTIEDGRRVGRTAGIYRCEVFGYVCRISKSDEASPTGSTPIAHWIGFPSQRGEVRKEEESVIFRKVRRYFYERAPDQHHWK